MKWLLGWGALLFAPVAAAQTSPVEVGQIASSTRKVDAEPLAIIKPLIPQDEQLTAPGERRIIAGSPGSREPADVPVQQLATGRPSAEGAPSLSRTEQSRPGAKEVLGGSDRCDLPERRRTAVCAKAIESRSAEFDRTPAPLSPEQRLLLEQRVGTRDAAYSEAARRLAGATPSDRSLEDQAVASVVLGPGPPPPAPKEDDDKKVPVTQEQAAAIVGAILNAPRN